MLFSSETATLLITETLDLKIFVISAVNGEGTQKQNPKLQVLWVCKTILS
jgi:hypothetical protein